MRVNARTPARKKMDVTNERERELVREDFLNHRFMDWANDVIEKAKVGQANMQGMAVKKLKQLNFLYHIPDRDLPLWAQPPEED